MKRLIMFISIAMLLFVAIALSACGEEHVHSFSEWVITKAPTCTEAGEQERICSCGERQTQTIAALGHTAGEAVKDNDKAPSCTENGSFDTVTYCIVCNAEISRITQTVPATGHTFSEWVLTKTPTCTEGGEQTRICVCGEKQVQSISANGHTAGQPVKENDKSPTCTENGSYDTVVYCTICNAEISRSATPIPAKGHAAVTDPAVAATCTTAGKTEGSHCSVCGATIEEQTIILAKGHNFVDHICTVCGDILGSDGLEYTIQDNGKNYSVTGIGTCKDSEIWIARMYNDKPVIAIAEKAFADQRQIVLINIPDSVISIGNRAFYNTGITEITIPSSVTSIGTQIIFKADNLKTVYFNPSNYYPSASSLNQFLNNDSICKVVFDVPYIPYHCAELLGLNNNVRIIEIADSVKGISEYAFSDCKNLTNVTIGDNVTSIDAYAFSGCDNLESISIGKSVKTIGVRAFNECKNLTNLKIGNNVKSIGREAFWHCTSLTDIVIPDSITEINGSAFLGCINLINVTIPDSVITIEGSAFSSCIRLVNITIPDSVTTIRGGAFSSCTSLASVTIGKNVTSIEDNAFFGCNKLIEICNRSNLKITIGNIFDGYIGYYAKRVYKDGETYIHRTSDGYLYYDDNCGNVFLLSYLGTEINLKLPEKLNGHNYEIYHNAFQNCTSLSSIVIPDSVTSIGESSFEECSSLTSVTIGDGVVLIGVRAFAACRDLESVTIGRNLASIEKVAFLNCQSLTSITLPATVISICEKAFLRCNNLKKVYYTGTEAQWKEISIDQYNESLTSATIINNYAG